MKLRKVILASVLIGLFSSNSNLAMALPFSRGNMHSYSGKTLGGSNVLSDYIYSLIKPSNEDFFNLPPYEF